MPSFVEELSLFARPSNVVSHDLLPRLRKIVAVGKVVSLAPEHTLAPPGSPGDPGHRLPRHVLACEEIEGRGEGTTWDHGRVKGRGTHECMECGDKERGVWGTTPAIWMGCECGVEVGLWMGGMGGMGGCVGGWVGGRVCGQVGRRGGGDDEGGAIPGGAPGLRIKVASALPTFQECLIVLGIAGLFCVCACVRMGVCMSCPPVVVAVSIVSYRFRNYHFTQCRAHSCARCLLSVVIIFEQVVWPQWVGDETNKKQ